MAQHITVAIDGPAGAGKSTIAKAVAAKLNALYLDTGAMYRAVGLYMMDKGISLEDTAAIVREVKDVPLSVRYADGSQRIFLKDRDVSSEIRQPDVTRASSIVSAIPEVRTEMVAMQRRIAEGQSVIMDGRDIGTKVLPDATVKIFLTATAEERAMRRYREMKEKDPSVTYEAILNDINDRDRRDTERAASPLTKAEDAHELDTTAMSLNEAIAAVTTLCTEAYK